MAEKLSVTLPSDLVHAINLRVDSGAYASTSEVLGAAIRTWLREEEGQEERLAEIRARIQNSIGDPRPNLSSQEVRDRLDALYAEHQDFGNE